MSVVIWCSRMMPLPPLPCWVALMCDYRGWLLAAAGRALSSSPRDGLGGVATRRGWVLVTSEGDMRRSGAGSQMWLRRWCPSS